MPQKYLLCFAKPRINSELSFGLTSLADRTYDLPCTLNTWFEEKVLRLRLIASIALSVGLLSPMVSSAQEMQLAYHDAQASSAAPSAPESDNLWNRIRAGLQLAELDSPLTQIHINWYAKRPDYVARMLDRSRRYLFHIVEEVEKRGMPMEIALLPMVESAFNPQAYSRSHAAGIWQFIPSTGKNYGLKQNVWYDGRRDVTAATQAALDYLQKLFMDFGSWELALAAYNCGEGCVSRAIKRNASQGRPADYLSLQLPPETRHYVPKLMAIKQLVLAPEGFGVELVDIPNEPYFTQVSIDTGAMDVRSAANLAGLSVDEFISLNPAFPRKLIKAGSDVSVLVPVDHAEVFQANLERGEWDSWHPVTARKGMTVAQIAKQYGTTPERLAEHNKLHLRKGRLVKDQVILTPVNNTEQSEPSAVSWLEAETDAKEASGARAKYHVVRRGETLAQLARKFHVSATSIKRWNQLKSSSKLKVGQHLLVKPATTEVSVHALASKADSAKGTTRYTVRRGDTLYSIANRFNVSVPELKSWNNLRGNSLPTGKRLTIQRS
jgi:membrane-bound lytic murein transglycosylase D